ncbi:MAG: hypothetical protein KDC84_02310 [Crocinitomicaceae bacterium]|nr:hypothetical protein [Crocinitomicaceae bacterium]
MRSKIVLLLFFFPFSIFAQEEEWLQQIMENYVNQNPDGIYDLDQIQRQFQELLSDPVLLDSSHPEEVERLFFLSPVLQKNIQTHIMENGDFLSIYELQSIPGISVELARNLSHLVRMKSSEFQMRSKKFHVNLSSGFNQDIGISKGYHTNQFLGAPHRFYFRSQFQIGSKIKSGFLYEKDAGEDYINRAYFYKIPHFSAFIELKGKKNIRNIIVGDYKLLLGQGLLIYQGYGFGKTIDQPGNIRTTSEVKANTSLSENFFQRGLAAHFKFGAFEWIPFVSYKMQSASLYEDSILYFKSLDLSGSLQTETEIQKQKNLTEFLVGSSFRLKKMKFELGLNYLHSRYNHPYSNQEKTYQIYNFPTAQMDHLSMDYKYFFSKGVVYGENAFYVQSKGMAFMNGVLLSVSKQTSILFHFRYYSQRYFGFYSSAIGENSSNQNELGIYFNVKHDFNRKWQCLLYADYFLFPWLKYGVDAPSSGFEVNGRLKYKWSRKMEMYINYRIKSKEENILGENDLNVLLRNYKQQLRIHFSTELDQKVMLSMRLEGNLYKTEEWTSGFLFYLNLQYKPNAKWLLNYRFNLFSTSNFDNAIYSLERSLGTITSFQVYSGEGVGSYLFVKYKPIKSVQINFKFAFQNYFNQLTIGSGNDEIKGNFRGKIGFEVKYSF